MKFLIDAQLPPRLAKALGREGHEALHVCDCGFLSAKDREVWQYAAKQGAAIITKDADFATMRGRTRKGPAVVWLRLGNVTNDDLIAALLRVLPEIVSAIEAGEGVVEVR